MTAAATATALAPAAPDFEQLYSQHRTLVYSICLRKLRNRDDAEDTTQIVFANAWRSLASLREESNLHAWLAKIAVNESIKLLRYRKSHRYHDHVSLSETVQTDEGDTAPLIEISVPADAVALLLLARDLVRIFPRLNAHDKESLHLRAVEGLSYAEMGAVLGIGLQAVKSRLYHARVRILAMMEAPA